MTTVLPASLGVLCWVSCEGPLIARSETACELPELEGTSLVSAADTNALRACIIIIEIIKFSI